MPRKKEKGTTKIVVDNKGWKHGHSAGLGGVYFLSLVGAAVYYVQQTSGFWPGVLGILKAIVWPAMLIYKVFTFLQM